MFYGHLFSVKASEKSPALGDQGSSSSSTNSWVTCRKIQPLRGPDFSLLERKGCTKSFIEKNEHVHFWGVVSKNSNHIAKNNFKCLEATGIISKTVPRPNV